MSHYEDIEISSHLLESDNQISFHFSIPYFNQDAKMVEEPIFVIMSSGRVFLFTSSVLDNYLSQLYSAKLLDMPRLITPDEGIFTFAFEFISDYYADITENLARKIKVIANKVLVEKFLYGTGYERYYRIQFQQPAD